MSTAPQRSSATSSIRSQDRARTVAAVSMTGAAVLATAGFTVLGSVFDYPDILKEPTTTILATYREHATTVSVWFLVLALSAALLAPTSLALGRLVPGRPGRWVAAVGVAAAVVQVAGLSRWVLFVPRLSQDAQDPSTSAHALRTFETLHSWLGHALGETVGYALTATFTILVIRALPGTPHWVRWSGGVAAALVATGIVVPLGLSFAELTNFAGYVLWSVWLVVVSVVVWRGRRRRH